ncbi:MAG: hypothetical protein ABII88_10645 [Candidatus Omnitrophota bacterium]
MRRFITILILIAFTSAGCATAQKKKPALENGFTMEQVVQLWGEPSTKAPVGMTRDKYPVEVWDYKEKGSLFKKDKIISLIFVDGELYSWAEDNPGAIMDELQKLGVISTEYTDFDMQHYQQWLRSITEEAIRTKQTLDTVNTYQNSQRIQMQIQHQQQMRILQQQQLRIPLPPPRPIQPVNTD